MLYDRALGHPNTRGFTFVYFLCSTTEHLATPTQGDLLLFTFCALRPSTWPPQHKGIYFCLLFCALRPSTWPPQRKGIYCCSLFDVCPFIFFLFLSITTTGEFYFLFTFTTFNLFPLVAFVFSSSFFSNHHW